MSNFAEDKAADAGNANYELLPCGIVRTDAKQRITFVNGMVRDWLDVTAEELVGRRRFNELLTIGGKIFFETHHATRLELEGAVRELNYDLAAKDGSRVPVLVNAHRLPEQTPGYLYVLLPFSERKKHEAVLKEAKLAAELADRAKATFISTISHEIRTPLHAILEAGNFLLKDNPRDDQAELITVLRSAGQNLLGIVNDILDMSKLESGLTELDTRAFHFQEIIDQAINTYTHRCREKGVTLRAELPETPLPPLMGDAVKIGQVINNLVSNATKFTANGEIVVGLARQCVGDRHTLAVSVRDTGIGIPEDRLEAVFQPFTQASAATSFSFGGTGLGLAIARRILEAHAAPLTVESEVGKGTTFRFTLTLPEAPPEAVSAMVDKQALADALPPLNHLRVVNIDDKAANLLINARYFREWKLNFVQYNNAADALAALGEEACDLVLLDLKMPEMDGYELARRIRRHPDPRVKALPLIALSASANRKVSEKMLDAGINGLVLKPFEPMYLHHLIKRYGEGRGGSSITWQDAAEDETATDAVDFTDVAEIFAGDDPDYKAFLEVIHHDLLEAVDHLGKCIVDFNEARFKTLKHNLVSTTRVFRLDGLRQQFGEAAELLEAGDRINFSALLERMITRIREVDAGVVGKIGELAAA